MEDNNRIGAVSWLVLLLGLVTTALGVAYGVATTPSGPATTAIVNTMAAAIVGSLGAGIVGAALSMVMTRVVDRARTQDLATVLSRSLTARFISSDEELDAIRGDWHHYHLTSMDGSPVWRYARLRLDRSPEINSLQTYVDVTDARGGKHRYNVEAGVRGTKGIILLQRARASTSSEAVEIFPGLTKAFHTIHYGIGVYEAWDGTNVVGKIVLSRQPIAPADRSGMVNETHFAELDRLWHQGFAAHHAILADTAPATTPPDGSPT